jgi:predicted NBD/HSP70 family sugar kinase
VGCMETLVSLRGLLESFSASNSRQENSWAELRESISKNGIPPWLAQALDAAAAAIAGALNVLGQRRVVITGSLTELPPSVLAHLSRAVQNGSMWAKFGTVECVAAPRRRTAGLVAAGIDQLIMPDSSPKDLVPKRKRAANLPR